MKHMLGNAVTCLVVSTVRRFGLGAYFFSRLFKPLTLHGDVVDMLEGLK